METYPELMREANSLGIEFLCTCYSADRDRLPRRDRRPRLQVRVGAHHRVAARSPRRREGQARAPVDRYVDDDRDTRRRAGRRGGRRRCRAPPVHDGLSGVPGGCQPSGHRHAHGGIRSAGRLLRPYARRRDRARSRCVRRNVHREAPHARHHHVRSRITRPRSTLRASPRWSGAFARSRAPWVRAGPTPRELENASVMRRSLVAATAIRAGTAITRDLVTTKRPASGLPPSALDSVVGARARVDIPPNAPLTLELLDGTE